MRVFKLSLMPLWLAVQASLSTGMATQEGWTFKHEEGRCAMKGQCGKESLFGGELPCADNGLAEDPDDDLREKLIDICGETYADGPVCCTEDQVDVLKSNLQRANQLISSCPACKENFYNLFCTFTCSPDQSLFLNVTKYAEKNDKYLVKEIDNLWTNKYIEGFYGSCKDVKFGPTNSRAMDFLGNGAKNGRELVAFLGQERPLVGSPFQINFPSPDDSNFKGMEPSDPKAQRCDSSDPKYRCACIDCPTACPDLPEVTQSENCHVGAWPCLSFAVVIVYTICLLLLVTAIVGHVSYRRHKQKRHERLRLLQDTALSDDESEDGEIVYQPTYNNRAPRKYLLNTMCDRAFSRLGQTCARFPAITIISSLFVVLVLSLGWIRFDVETDPVRLWVAPDSPAAEEKAFFDANFGPFFRTEQAFLVNDTQSSGPGPVLSYETLIWWFDVESRVERLKSYKKGVTFEDVCYNPTGEACILQSITRFWDGDASGVNQKNWAEHLEYCAENPSDLEEGCFQPTGPPMDVKLLLGGGDGDVLNSEALIATWVVENHDQGSPEEARAMEWEEELKNLLQSIQVEANERGLRLSFSTEISLEQELNKSTNTDAKIVVVSYIIMFLYASLALGSTTITAVQILRKPSSALIQSKFSLGVVGIVIVLLSVSSSVGLFSALGIKVTLIIAEVIPFLILAVGVDNIFLIVHEFERINAIYPNEPVADRTGKALGRMGPSILLSASMETVAFALGAFVGMPAVRNFAAYAAGAVVINALLQVTMFISFLALNQQRVEAGKADCIPCLQVEQPISLPDDAPHSEDGLQSFIRRIYAPALLGKKTKVAITAIFAGLFTLGLALLPLVELGLDQRIAIPNGSYLISYFNDLYDYFDAGPPVYFVTRELNITSRMHQEQLCGRFVACGEYSLTNLVEQERKRPEASYIKDPAASWVDDYFLWLNPDADKCCVDSKTGKPCMDGRWNVTLEGLPEGREYLHYLSYFLQATALDEDCPIGGKASYSNAVVLPPMTDDGQFEKITLPASHFRSSHTSLRNQTAFINAYKSARRIANEIEENNPDLSVFPYSKFYVFFDQYVTIVSLSVTLLACAIVACFLISSLLLGSLRTGAAVAITVIMTVVDVAGTMALGGVSLNALTLVNLVICVGISVEFCAHIARAFQFPSTRLLEAYANPSEAYSTYSLGAGTSNGYGAGRGSNFAQTSAVSFRSRDARAWAALSQVGSSVFSGITVTKLLGVCVLAFTRSKIFEIYYFRIWLALVILGAAHALIWLPVLLSWIGGDGYVDPESDGSLEEDLTRRRIRGLLPDDDHDDEEEDY